MRMGSFSTPPAAAAPVDADAKDVAEVEAAPRRDGGYAAPKLAATEPATRAARAKATSAAATATPPSLARARGVPDDGASSPGGGGTG